MIKPIFIIQFPKHTPPEVIKESEYFLKRDKKELTEQYHVLLTGGGGDEMKYFCFNSPYKEKEFKDLKDLINKIDNDYEQRN